MSLTRHGRTCRPSARGAPGAAPATMPRHHTLNHSQGLAKRVRRDTPTRVRTVPTTNEKSGGYGRPMGGESPLSATQSRAPPGSRPSPTGGLRPALTPAPSVSFSAPPVPNPDADQHSARTTQRRPLTSPHPYEPGLSAGGPFTSSVVSGTLMGTGDRLAVWDPRCGARQAASRIS